MERIWSEKRVWRRCRTLFAVKHDVEEGDEEEEQETARGSLVMLAEARPMSACARSRAKREIGSVSDAIGAIGLGCCSSSGTVELHNGTGTA